MEIQKSQRDNNPKELEYYFILKKQDISFFKFIIEGYDGIGFVSTIDPKRSLVRVLIDYSLKMEFLSIIERLEPYISIFPIENKKNLANSEV